MMMMMMMMGGAIYEWMDNDDGEMRKSIRVLKAVAAFVAVEEFVRETNVAAHAANSLKIHHN